MRICVIGAGWLVAAACFAEMGNRVIYVERDAARLARLTKSPLSTKWPACAHAWRSISRRCAVASAVTSALGLTLSTPAAAMAARVSPRMCGP
jgi:hypothetical protein